MQVAMSGLPSTPAPNRLAAPYVIRPSAAWNVRNRSSVILDSESPVTSASATGSRESAGRTMGASSRQGSAGEPDQCSIVILLRQHPSGQPIESRGRLGEKSQFLQFSPADRA